MANKKYQGLPKRLSENGDKFEIINDDINENYDRKIVVDRKNKNNKSKNNKLNQSLVDNDRNKINNIPKKTEQTKKSQNQTSENQSSINM